MRPLVALNYFADLSVIAILLFGKRYETYMKGVLGSARPSCTAEGGLRGSENGLNVIPSVDRLKPPSWSENEAYELRWTYLSDEKDWPYVGSQTYLATVPNKTWYYYNSLAVFPNEGPKRLHGSLGFFANGTRIYQPGPKPPPITETNKKEALKNGGFYLALSDHLPLDRDVLDQRPNVCRNQKFNINELDDVTIIITFYDEPLSTLLRSVHSILNLTPPPLLREIILVDDHSTKADLLPGAYLDHYIRSLPKVKLLRQPSRRGLVTARLAGVQIARAPVVVILDSHIEVSEGWLEPQLQRLKESPESIVFPQIPGIKPEDFSFLTGEGIGCKLSFKWIMQEKAQGLIAPRNTDAIPSATMAGGLFAVRRDWFWELGGYDEEFSMWGAENVEMPFRTWMCGGKIECTPCAFVYHIYRKGGSGYKSPPQSIWKNRLRTAKIWTGDFYNLTAAFIGHPFLDLGPLDHMLELKRRLRCKDFSWFMEHIDKDQPIRSVKNITIAGEIRNKYGVYYCHGSGGTQGYIRPAETQQLHSYTDETLCLGGDIHLRKCLDLKGGHWDIGDNSTLVWSKTHHCLTMVKSGSDNEVRMEPCTSHDPAQQWKFKPFEFSTT